MNFVKTRSETQVGNFRENDKEAEESSGVKKAKIEENPSTPPE